MVIHVILGRLIFQNGTVTILHQSLTLGLTVVFLLLDKEPYRVMYMLGYITGAEMLWRGNQVSVLYEIGKYSVGFVCMVLLLKRRSFARSYTLLPIYYFILLLPSILLATAAPRQLYIGHWIPIVDDVFSIVGLDRERIAFNLSGPFVLAMATAYCSTLELTRQRAVRFLVATLLPIISLAASAAYSILSAEDIFFGRSSNGIASADFGPNQFSSLLGLGALIAFWLIILVPRNRLLKILLAFLSVDLLGQSALTFSRGGFWTGAIALGVCFILLLNDGRYRLPLLIFGVGAFILVSSVVFPALESFTKGALGERFSSLESSGRDDILRGDIQAFLENPIFGVGPDIANEYRATAYNIRQAHTEYTRMLAEHGLSGVVALFILGVICLKRVITHRPTINIAFALSFTVWALLFMTHAALRLAAPAFLFGFASTTLLLDANSTPKISNPKKGAKFARYTSV
jgi:hypothetical protein